MVARGRGIEAVLHAGFCGLRWCATGSPLRADHTEYPTQQQSPARTVPSHAVASAISPTVTAAPLCRVDRVQGGPRLCRFAIEAVGWRRRTELGGSPDARTPAAMPELRKLQDRSDPVRHAGGLCPARERPLRLGRLGAQRTVAVAGLQGVQREVRFDPQESRIGPVGSTGTGQAGDGAGTTSRCRPP